MAHLGHQRLGTAHHPAQYITVPGQEFGGTVHHYIHAQGQRVLVQRGGEGVVGHHHGASLPGGSAQALDVQYLEGGVGRGFQIQQVATRGDLALQRFGVEGVTQADLHAHARQELFEDLVGTAVTVAGRYHTLAA